MAKILQIVRGDYYPYLDDTCNIRIIDRSTHELSNYDFSECYAILQIQKLQIRYESDVLNTKILPITLTREQTYSLTPTKLENGYLAIYRNDETKKKTKFTMKAVSTLTFKHQMVRLILILNCQQTEQMIITI